MKKYFLIAYCLASALLLYSCGSDSKETSNEETASETGTGETVGETAGGKTSPTNEIKAAAGNAIDINAPSDSKGVGPVKSYNVKAFDAELAKEGEVLFTSKCAVCHQLDAKLIGPPLKGITKRRTPEWIMNMALNPSEMQQKDPVAKALLEEYKTPMTDLGLTEKEAAAIYEYFRQVDGAK